MATPPILWLDADISQQEMDPNAPRRAIKAVEASSRSAAVYERHPQWCTDGNEVGSIRRNYQRFVHVVRHDGNVVRAVITNAAAHTDTNTGYAQNQRNKHWHFGWFKFGKCPIAAAAAGELQPHLIKSDAIAALVEEGAPACNPKVFGPKNLCPHALAEIEERRKQHNDKQAKSEDAVRTDSEKAVVALAEAAVASGKDNAALIASFTALIEKLTPTVAAPAAKPAETPKPTGGGAK